MPKFVSNILNPLGKCQLILSKMEEDFNTSKFYES